MRRFHNERRPLVGDGACFDMVDDKKSALARLKASRSSRRAEGGGIPEWNATPEPPAPRCRLSSERLSLNIISTHHPTPLSLRDDRPRHSAATSHRANDEYMARMEDGMRSMGITSGGNDDDDDDGDAHPTVRQSQKPRLLHQPSRAFAPGPRTRPVNSSTPTSRGAGTTARASNPASTRTSPTSQSRAAASTPRTPTSCWG